MDRGCQPGKRWSVTIIAFALTQPTTNVQDIYPGQPFFIPPTIEKFKDETVHLVAVQDGLMNLDWNAIAYASSISNRSFSSVVNKMMSMTGKRER